MTMLLHSGSAREHSGGVSAVAGPVVVFFVVGCKLPLHHQG